MTDNNLEYKLEAKRGWLYLYHDDNAVYKDKYVIVVSNDNRSTDKLVSILMLQDSSSGSDVIPVKVPNVGTMYVHTGMITYFGRHLLTKEVCQLSKKTMERIDNSLCYQYGLVTNKEILEYNMYKNLYEDLLDRLTGIDKTL